MLAVGAAGYAQLSARLKAPLMGCRLWKSIGQTFATSGLSEAMTYDVEVYDPFGLHDNVTNPSRITIPAGWSGVWAMGGQVTWTANGTGQRDAFIRRAMAAGGTEQAIFRREAGSALFSSPLYLSTETYLAEGDYVELWAMQSSGGSLTSQRFTAHSPTFWASYRGT